MADTILFAHCNESEVGMMMNIVELFCNASGLKINFSSSQVLSVYIDDVEVDLVAKGLTCHSGILPINYVQLLLRGKSKIGDVLQEVGIKGR